MKQLWFRAKVYGWGWYPATWQGWLVTILYVGIVVLLTSSYDEQTATATDTLWSFIMPLAVSTAVFIGIAYKTGEKPEWRWGSKKLDK